MHNTIDSCILQLVTSATRFALAWQSSGLQRLVSIKVHNVAVPMGSHGVECLCVLNCSADIFFNKQCIIKIIVPNYANIKVLATSPATRETQDKAQVTRMKEEFKFLYKTQRQCKPWDPIDTAPLCTLIDTNLYKPDDGQARPKHVADVTSCTIQLSIDLCKDVLIQ